MLAGGLLSIGMNWWQALIIIGLGNSIVLLPILANSHPGTEYGISFPVFARSTFGIHGVHCATLIRAVVSCGCMFLLLLLFIFIFIFKKKILIFFLRVWN